MNELQEIIIEKLTDNAAVTDDAIVNVPMLDALDQMNKTTVNRSYRAIPASSFRGRVVRLCKRMVRRMTFWYVEPCMMQQTEYNAANDRFAAEANSQINAHTAAIQTMQQQYSALVQQQEKTVLQCEELRQENAALRTRVDAMQQRMDADTQGCRSFSQTGEDAIIRYLFSVYGIAPKDCRYLDLGANHAVYLSNTYSFYREGARGVLVDANPVLTKELAEERPGDIVLNRCISDKSEGMLPFYIMSGDGLSTMDRDAAQGFIRENPALSIERTVMVDTITIGELMDTYFRDKAPDILNIDIEGMELTVLRMMDFARYRPHIIICEMIEYRSTLTVGEKNQEILEFMRSVGYEEFAFTGINSIFVDRKGETA